MVDLVEDPSQKRKTAILKAVQVFTQHGLNDVRCVFASSHQQGSSRHSYYNAQITAFMNAAFSRKSGSSLQVLAGIRLSCWVIKGSRSKLIGFVSQAIGKVIFLWRVCELIQQMLLLTQGEFWVDLSFQGSESHRSAGFDVLQLRDGLYLTRSL